MLKENFQKFYIKNSHNFALKFFLQIFIIKKMFDKFFVKEFLHKFPMNIKENFQKYPVK